MRRRTKISLAVFGSLLLATAGVMGCPTAPDKEENRKFDHPSGALARIFIRI